MSHRYLSTSCYHNDHEYCKSPVGLAGSKKPASCKFCEAGCICGCHVIRLPDLESYKPIGWLDEYGAFHELTGVTDGTQ